MNGRRRTAEERYNEFFQKEESILSPYATKNREAKRKIRTRGEGLYPPFWLDANKILHSSAYTRYIDKTQVFYLIENDHITHRVLHVQLVSQIARIIGRALGLNNDLIEAIALGHDIGHAPFGHEGEEYLSELCKKHRIGEFHHNVQSVIFLDELEEGGKGLNLTLQVLDGVLCHDGEKHDEYLKPDQDKDWSDLRRKMKDRIKKGKETRLIPMTLEGCVVRLADTIGYVGRDIEDAIRVELIKKEDLPEECTQILGKTNKKIVDTLVKNVIKTSKAEMRVNEKPCVRYSEKISNAVQKLKKFNLENIYRNERIKTESDKIKKMYEYLFEVFVEHIKEDKKDSRIFRHQLAFMDSSYKKRHKPAEIVRDFIAGMTDDYFIASFKELYFPRRFEYNINGGRKDMV